MNFMPLSEIVALKPRAMELPPLPSKKSKRDELIGSFRGPTKRSNWVVPGRLMAGDRSSLDCPEGLAAILKAGVSCIVPGSQP